MILPGCDVTGRITVVVTHVGAVPTIGYHDRHITSASYFGSAVVLPSKRLLTLMYTPTFFFVT